MFFGSILVILRTEFPFLTELQFRISNPRLQSRPCWPDDEQPVNTNPSDCKRRPPTAAAAQIHVLSAGPAEAVGGRQYKAAAAREAGPLHRRPPLENRVPEDCPRLARGGGTGSNLRCAPELVGRYDDDDEAAGGRIVVQTSFRPTTPGQYVL